MSASSQGPSEHPLALSASLARSETVEAAVARLTELAGTVFDQPVVHIYQANPHDSTLARLGSSVPSPPHADTSTDRIPAPVVEQLGRRDGAHSAAEPPEATVISDVGGPLGVEAFVPVGADWVLSLGVTGADEFDETDVAAIEGLAPVLETTLARLERSTESTSTMTGTGSGAGEQTDRHHTDSYAGDATALQRLNELVVEATEFDETIEGLLSLGCDHLGLDTGILSHVGGDDYKIEAVVDATETYERGTMYNLGETMCQATLAGDATESLAFADVTDTDHRSHPAAESIRAYIAAPVIVDGETYGTVNFSMESPRGQAFRREDEEFVKLVAQWAGTELERRRRFGELERYETILEALGDPVYALDTQGRFTFVNEAAEREFGYGLDIVGEGPSVGMDESDVERIQDQIEELLATGDRSTTAEFELETADGGRKMVENRLAVIGDDKFRGTAGVLRDITARNERRQQLESFQQAIEEAADGVAILDGEEYTYIDQSHLDMYGFETKDELLGETWRELYDDEEVARLEREAFPALESEGRWRGAVTGRRRDGSTFPAELSLTIIGDGRLVCAVRDETERMARKRELELKERAMNEATVGIQITDPRQNGNPLVYVNDGFERMTGYDREEAIGRNPRFLQGADTDPEQVARLRDAVSKAEPVSLELQNCRKDGTPYWTRLTLTPVRDENGTVQNFVGIQQDVTESKQREQQKQATVDVLERAYEVTTDNDRSFEDKLQGLLAAGREYLDLPNGFLTRIETGDEYEAGTQFISEAQGEHELLQPGESCPLPQSYCKRTIQNTDLTVITDAANEGWAGDPAYDIFGLETYIAGSVDVDGDTFGTLCFASQEPRERGFTETEQSFVSLLRSWVGYELDRRDARDRLREQREKLELTLSGTDTGLAEWDLKTDAVTWNETLVDIVGRDVSTIEEFRAAVHPDDRDRVQGELETMIETGDPWTGEFRTLDDDGDATWLGTRATPVYNDDGEPVRVLATGTDISKRKEAGRERRRNGRRFESLFNDPGMLVGLLDTDGSLLDVNETALEYVDAEPGTLHGEPFWETPWWTDSDVQSADVREWVERAVAGEYVEYSGTHTRPDGDRRHITGVVRPVTDEDGTVRSVLVSGRDVTERERQQRKLRDQQQKLDLVLSNTDTSVVELDFGDGVVNWDGMVGDNNIGSPETVEALIETVHPDDRARVRSDIETMMQAAEPLKDNYRFVTEDGDMTWVAVQALPVDDEPDSTPEQAVAIATDITDLKQREAELEESQSRYQTLLQAAPDPVFVAAVETGEIIETNAAAEAVFGRPRDDIIGCEQTDLHPDGDAELYAEAFEQSVGNPTMLSELPDGTQPKLRTAEGETVPVEINADTVQLPQGPVMYGVFRDISGRKDRERELELKERAMNEAATGITISDPDMEDNPLIYVNDGFVEQTGYSREEAVGRNCRFLQADDRDQSALDDLRDAIAAEESTTVELRNYSKDGEQFWNRLSVTPVYDERGELTNHVGIQQDVTEEKVREQRMRAILEATQELLRTDTIDEAASKAVETLATEFGYHQGAFYRKEGDELVSTALMGESTAHPPERIERGRTPLWDALETDEPVHYDDCGTLSDGIDRGDVTASAYFPVGDHGVVVVGAKRSERLGESERRPIELLTGTLAAVLDTLDREMSLRTNKRRYRSLAENIPNGAVLTFDADFEYRLGAGELLSTFGIDEKTIPGTTVDSVFSDADADDELLSQMRAALDGERTDRRLEIGDRTLRLHIVPVEREATGGTETHGLMLAQDITDEARRKRELFEERERFRLLTESVDEYAFLLVDEDGDLQTWNEGAENLFGYDAEAAADLSMGDLHPEADREAGLPERLLEQARIAGESAHEGWRVRANGSEFYADVRYAPLDSDDGEFRGYAKIVRDMTERRNQRRRTERFVEESDDVVTVVDTDGTVSYTSGSAERVLGYDPADLVGENLFDSLHPDSRERVMNTFFECIEGSDNTTTECRVASPDGGWLNVDVRCRNMLDDEAIEGILVYLRDITESKKRARRFESIFNQTFQFTGLLEPDGTVLEVNDAALEFGGVERDDIVGAPFFEASWWTHSEAVHDDVREAIDRAANGEFVRYETEVNGAEGLATIDFSLKPVTDEDGDVSLLVAEGRDVTAQQQQRQHMEVLQRVMRHNMRNDLTKVRGWTQVMCDEPDAEKRTEQFETIAGILDVWDGMTERMADIRQHLQSQRGQSSTTDLDSIVEDAVTPLRNEHDDATIVTDASDGGSAQMPTTLTEAIRELVDNATHADEDATVEVESARQDDDWIEISVRDDGPGLPDMEAELLESGEETALNHGQGLGLWMVRIIVTQAGGDVSVESTDDGTAVCLRLPAQR